MMDIGETCFFFLFFASPSGTSRVGVLFCQYDGSGRSTVSVLYLYSADAMDEVEWCVSPSDVSQSWALSRINREREKDWWRPRSFVPLQLSIEGNARREFSTVFCSEDSPLDTTCLNGNGKDKCLCCSCSNTFAAWAKGMRVCSIEKKEKATNSHGSFYFCPARIHVCECVIIHRAPFVGLVLT